MRRLSLALLAPLSLAGSGAASFADLSKNQVVSGFKTAALYLNDSDQPFAARFKYVKKGYTLDLTQVQSVPQAFN